MGGLVSVDDPGQGAMTITATGAGASRGPQAGKPKASRPGLESSVSTTSTTSGQSTPIESQLDEFFKNTAWTREDVLVVAASLQIVFWSILLYHEVAR